MSIRSVVASIIDRFASIDIVIEPEESAVREAVTKLRASDPKYFDGVKKIIVEHGNPKSPYLGKSTGDGTIYISLDAIKNQLESAGLKDDQQAFSNELLKTIGHEMAHIKGGMAPTETASEVEEHVLEQKFPTPAMLAKAAATLSESERKALNLSREIRELKDKLELLDAAFLQLTKSETGEERRMDPERKKYFIAQQDELNKALSTKVAELEALRASMRGPAPEEDVGGSQSEVGLAGQIPEQESLKYKSILAGLAGNMGLLLGLLSKLQSTLSASPSFVRGEKGVVEKLVRVIAPISALNNGIAIRLAFVEKSKGAFGRSGMLDVLEKLEDATIGIERLIRSDSDFIKPLTNQAAESQFYASSISPIIYEIEALLKTISDVVESEGKAVRSIPDAPPQQPTRPVTAPAGKRPKQVGGRESTERDLNTIRKDYVEELAQLTAKKDAARSLFRASADVAEVDKLTSEKAAVDKELVKLRERIEALAAEIENLATAAPSKENAANRTRLSEEYRDVFAKVSELDERSQELRFAIASLYTTQDINPDELLAKIAPYTNMDKLESRIEGVNKKLQKFRDLDDAKSELMTKTQEFDDKQKSYGFKEGVPTVPLSPEQVKELEGLYKEISEHIPKKIRDLENELAAVSSPRGGRDLDAVRVRESIKANMEQLESPLLKSLLERMMPQYIAGGHLRGEMAELKRKIKVRSSQPISASDTELFTWHERLSNLHRGLTQRRTPELLEFMGRLGQAANSIVFNQAVDPSVLPKERRAPSMPEDILGSKLVLRGYDHKDGNEKIVRDLQSAVAANLRNIQVLEREFRKVDDELHEAENLAAENPDAAREKIALLRTKKRFLAEQPAYTNFMKSLGDAIERIVMHVETSSAEVPPTIREKGRGAVGPGDVTKLIREPGAEISEEERLKREVEYWQPAEPEGRVIPKGLKKHEIELGLFDVSAVPQNVRKELLNRLHASAGEMREIKARLSEPDREIRAIKEQIDAATADVEADPDQVKRTTAKLVSNQERILRSTARLRQRASELHSEIGKIRDLLKDPAKYVFDIPTLEKELDSAIESEDALLAKSLTTKQNIDDLQAQFDAADPAEQRNLSNQISELRGQYDREEAAKREASKRVQRIESKLRAAKSRMKGLSPQVRERETVETGLPKVREYIPSEKERERMRDIYQSYQVTVDRGVAVKAAKYRAADEDTKRAMMYRREFIDPKNPEKALPSTRMLGGMRRMRWAYKKALELNPPGENQESAMRTAAYHMQEIDNYMRALDDEYLRKASGKAIAATSDPREQYVVRFKLLDEMHKSDEYVKALQLVRDAMNRADEAATITTREGLAALKDVAKGRHYPGVGYIPGYRGEVEVGRGKGRHKRERRVKETAEPMLGYKNPTMLFFAAAYDAEQKLQRYKLAAAAKKKLDRARAKARAEAIADGKSEEEIEKEIENAYNSLYYAMIKAQEDLFADFNKIVDKLSESGQGKVPTTYYDPAKTVGYLKEFKDAQAAMVRAKELDRRWIQVREIPKVTSNIMDPDRFPKFLAEEFSLELPTVSEITRSELSAKKLPGGELYNNLSYILPHILYGYHRGEKGAERRKSTTPTPESESRFVETVEQKFHPAPVRPGGKMGPGETPQFMTQKIEPMPRK